MKQIVCDLCGERMMERSDSAKVDTPHLPSVWKFHIVACKIPEKMFDSDAKADICKKCLIENVRKSL